MSSNLHQLREGKFDCLMVFTSKWGSNLRDLDGIKRLKNRIIDSSVYVCRSIEGANLHSNKMKTPIYSPDGPLSCYPTQLASSNLDLAPLAILSKLTIFKCLRFFQEPLIFENFSGVTSRKRQCFLTLPFSAFHPKYFL